MPISFSCHCGKAMQAKDAFAGRKLKCPQCGAVVAIPKLKKDKPVVTTRVAERDEEERLPPPRPVPRPSVKATQVASQDDDTPPPRARVPLARPVARPVTMLADEPPPLAKPVAPPTTPRAPTTQTPAPHPWVDQSLTQTPTPWLPGDEERFQKGLVAPREGMSGLAKALIVIAIVAVLGVGGFLLASGS